MNAWKIPNALNKINIRLMKTVKFIAMVVCVFFLKYILFLFNCERFQPYRIIYSYIACGGVFLKQSSTIILVLRAKWELHEAPFPITERVPSQPCVHIHTREMISDATQIESMPG